MQPNYKAGLSTVIFVFLILFIGKHSRAQEIWGMTKYGGDYNKGVIFKMNEGSNLQEVVFSFENMGLPEGKMTEYTDGVFYGMTTSGWGPSNGIIYRFDSAAGGFTKVVEFDGVNTGKDGSGSLILASNGMFYGMTASGGAYDKGVFFEFNPETEAVTKLFDFDGYERGSEPLGSLIESSDGHLYGMTSMGGKFDAGIIFSYNLKSGSFTKVIQFDGAEYGSNPMGSLIKSSDGLLYGMTRWGGTYDHGVIFQFNPTGRKLEILFSFNGPQTGRNPHGSLTEASNGKLYGIAPFGGPYDQGVLFEFERDSSLFTITHNFYEEQSYGSLLEAPDEKLYGVFNNTSDTAALLFSFDPETRNLDKLGKFPNGLRDYYGSMESLTLASNGNLFFWGRDNFYIDEEIFLFEFDYESGETINHYSNSSFATGSYPIGQLVQASHDSLYGLAARGGMFDHGSIFLYDRGTDTFSKVVDFYGSEKGSTPTGSLVQAENSKLFGMTSKGGKNDEGVIFEFDPVTGVYNKVFDFNGSDTGGNPNGNLVLATNGKFYGMTITGGKHNNGVLFEFNPASDDYQVLFEFDPADSGNFPRRSITLSKDGTLYGITKYGGAYDAGMLFSYSVDTGIFTKIADCNNWPVAIMQSSDNNMYVSGYRSVYEYNPGNQNYRKLENISTSGFTGELFEISEDVLWGMDFGEIAYQSGIEDRGMIFEYNVKTNEFSVKTAFTGPDGRHPENSGLMKIHTNAGPLAKCKNTILFLDETGQATLLPEEIDNISTGETINLTVNKDTFTCEDTGENTVVLTATDLNGSSSTCNAVVFIKDTLPPQAVCRNIEVFPDGSGIAEIEVADIDNGSTDACGIKSVTSDLSVFTCEHLGENTVQLTVTDNNGNSSVCLATVTVIDSIAPSISHMAAASRFLNPYKKTFTAVNDYELNAKAADNCTVQSLTYEVESDGGSFTGSSLSGHEMKAGTYNFVWRAFDGSGNESSFLSVVTINKRPVKLLNLEKETDIQKQEVYLKAVLIDDLLAQGIEGKQLIFTVGELSVEAVTGANGSATVAVPLNELPAGAYKVEVSFTEDDTYTSGYLESEIITSVNTAKSTAFQVYPNPFTEKLYVEFVAHETANARIDLYDSSGRLVETMFDKPVEAGIFYKSEYSPDGIPGGLYVYKLRNGNMITNGKIIFRE